MGASDDQIRPGKVQALHLTQGLDRVVDDIMFRLRQWNAAIVYRTKVSIGYCEMDTEKSDRVMQTPNAVIGVYRRGVNRAHIYEDITWSVRLLETVKIYKDRARRD